MAHLPHVSRHLGDDGATIIHLRPPLLKGLELYFRSRGKPLPLSHGEIWQMEGSADVVTYATPLMVEQNVFSCRQAEIAGSICINGETFYKSSKEFSRHLVHGTTIQNALDILCCGHINAGPGIAEGIYAFEIPYGSEAPGEDRKSLAAGWQRCATGGYNHGAIFLLQTDGILVKSSWKNVIPAGCVGYLRDQYSAAPGSVQYKSVTFDLRGLLGAIGEHMDGLGYSAEMHDALIAIQNHLRQGGPAPAGGAVKLLLNTCVDKTNTGKRKPTVVGDKPQQSEQQQSPQSEQQQQQPQQSEQQAQQSEPQRLQPPWKRQQQKQAQQAGSRHGKGGTAT